MVTHGLVKEEMLTAIRGPYMISGGAVSVSDVRQDGGVCTSRQSAASTHATSPPLVRDGPLRLPLRQTPLKTLTLHHAATSGLRHTGALSSGRGKRYLVSCQRHWPLRG
jgi:hypothetical protein